MSLFRSAAQGAQDKVRHTDPLLRITKALLFALMALAIVVGVAAAVAIPALWLVPNHVTIDDTTLTRDSFAALSAILATVLALAILAMLFLRQIIAIVDSVKIGSPFVPENARRLRMAGWIVLAIEVLSFFAESLGRWIKTVAPDAQADIDIDFSFGWLITALLLFILARVFDHGTRLAEDVEGTV